MIVTRVQRRSVAPLPQLVAALWALSTGACSAPAPPFSGEMGVSTGAAGDATGSTSSTSTPTGTTGSATGQGSGSTTGSTAAPTGASGTGANAGSGSGGSVTPTGTTTGSTTTVGGGAGSTAVGGEATGGSGVTSLAGAGGGAVVSGGTDAGGASAGTGGAAAAGDGSGGAVLDNPLGAPDVYITRCASCHGVDAKGDVLGPEIEHAAAPLLEYYVRNGDDNIWMGCDADDPTSDRPCETWGDQRVMTPFDATLVSDADMAAITAWLDALPKPTTGAELYADYCAYCHGPGGDIPAFTYYVKSSGPVTQPDLAEFQTVVKDGLTANRTIDERSRYMPPFAALLTDAEIQLIADWMCTQTYATLPAFCN